MLLYKKMQKLFQAECIMLKVKKIYYHINLQTLSQTQTSPGPRKVLVQKRESPKSSTSFPSKSTFHAAEGSPQKQARGEPSVKDTATMTRSKIGRRHKLTVPSSRKLEFPLKLECCESYGFALYHMLKY